MFHLNDCLGSYKKVQSNYYRLSCSYPLICKLYKPENTCQLFQFIYFSTMARITCILLLAFSFSSFAQTNLDTLSFSTSMAQDSALNKPVLIGEAHEVKGTYEAEAFMIEELVKRGNTHLVLESGVSEIAILSEYLKTGNEDVLQFTRARGQNYRKFIQRLREIYLLHPEMTLQGVDFERPVCLEYVFNKCFTGITDPALMPAINRLREIKANTSPKEVKEILLEVRAQYQQCESGFETALKENASNLKQIVFNPVFMKDFMFTSKTRDENIVKNLAAISSADLNKSIIIFGSNHFTNKSLFWTGFANLIGDSTDCRLFLFAYKDCTNFLKKGKYSSDQPLATYVANESSLAPKVDFIAAYNKEISLTKPDGKFVVVRLVGQ